MADLASEAQAAISRLREAGLTEDEARLAYINSLTRSDDSDHISFEDIEAYDQEREKQHANGHDKGVAGRTVRRPMQWRELAAKEPPSRIWLADQWLTTGVTLIAGPGGTGKSLLAQTLGTALALGQPYISSITEPRAVLDWACEDDHDELWRRQLAICNYFGVVLGDLPENYVMEPRLGRSNGLTHTQYGALVWTELYAELRDQVNDYRAAVVILDNIGQLFGGNENDRHHVTEFLNGLLALASWPLAILLLGHPAKASGSEYSGSTAWQNAVRMRWFMGDKLPDQQQTEDEEQADPNVRYLAKRKANYTAHDYRKLIWTNGVYVPETQPEQTFQERYGRRGDGAEACLLAGLDRLSSTNVRCTASSASPDFLPRLLVSAALAQDYTRQELTTAMNRMRAAGKIGEVVIGKYPNRTPKYGLGRTNEPHK